MDAFRTKKETIKATYTAAQAQTRIGEAFSGISEEMGDVGLAIQRAEDKTAQLQARAGAIDELLASGALDDQSGHGQGRHPGRAGPALRWYGRRAGAAAHEGGAGRRSSAPQQAIEGGTGQAQSQQQPQDTPRFDKQ